MSGRLDSVLLSDLALEEVQLRTLRRQRLETIVVHQRSREGDLARGMVDEHSHQLDPGVCLAREERGYADFISSRGIEHGGAEHGHVQQRHAGERSRFGVASS